MRKLLLLTLLTMSNYCHAGEKVDIAPLGSRDNPVKCYDPKGEREYLNRLTGPNGEPIKYYRVGSVGAAKDGHILDLYKVKYQGSTKVFEVHMDMYHKGHRETKPIKGLKMKE